MIEACEFSGGSRALKGRDRVLFHALRMVCRSFGRHVAARLLLVVDAMAFGLRKVDLRL